MHGFLKHPELQRLLEVRLPLPPEVLQLHLSPSDAVEETADHGNRVDLIRRHAGSPCFIVTLVGVGEGGRGREGGGVGQKMEVCEGGGRDRDIDES